VIDTEASVARPVRAQAGSPNTMPDNVPVDEICSVNAMGPSRFSALPQYTVTMPPVELRVEKAPLALLGPVYVPPSTPPVLMPPENVYPPPERLTARAVSSKVPVNDTALPPAGRTIPVACATARGRIDVVFTVA
jgi:hypothetical protein